MYLVILLHGLCWFCHLILHRDFRDVVMITFSKDSVSLETGLLNFELSDAIKSNRTNFSKEIRRHFDEFGMEFYAC
jgi:hypothetical protein